MWISSSIARELTPLSGYAWRVTQPQDTMARLLTTDPFVAPELLLDLINDGGRDYPHECQHLHPWLKAPFEHRENPPPMSRFRRHRATHRVLYLAQQQNTALAEFSYHQFVFFSASEGHAWPSRPRPIVVFQTHYATRHGIDLTAAPFVADRDTWIDPENYGATHAFGDAAYAANSQAIRFESARVPNRKVNIALFDCTCIDVPAPSKVQPWDAIIEPGRITLYITLPDYPTPTTTTTVFDRSVFELAGRLPRPRGNELLEE